MKITDQQFELEEDEFDWSPIWPLFELVYNPYSGSLWTNFQENHLTDFQKSRTALIWSALESSDPGASNGASIVEIWPNAADLVGFEIMSLTRNWVWNHQKSWQKHISFCQLCQFKRDEINSKKSNADVWLAIGCVRIRAFQRRSNDCCTTCEAVAPYFRKWDEMFEFWAK